MKLLKLLTDIRILLAIATIFLLISFVDVMAFSDATSIFEMTWWGQTSIYTFFVFFLAIIFSPIVGWIRGWFK